MRIFLHRFFAFRPYKPRNPLLRLAVGLIGLVLLAFLVVFGLFAGLGMLLYAAVRRMTRPHHKAAQATTMRDPNTIDGEYSIVQKQQPTLHLH